MKLINLSNHPSDKWGTKQKAEFEEIIDFPFPNIPSNYTTEQVKELVDSTYKKVKQLNDKLRENSFVGITIQGEFTFSYLFFDLLKNNLEEYIWNIYIPCTERKVQEKISQEGKVEKISVFEFCGWRII